jgi:hypothetical protein
LKSSAQFVNADSAAGGTLSAILSVIMKMLAIEREIPGVLDSQFTSDLLKSEAEKAWQLHISDVVREMYFSEDQHNAVLVLECSTVEEARRSLSELPLVRNGLIAFDVIPLAPYTGFSRLFRS